MITLLLVLSLAAMLKGVAWTTEAVCEWAHSDRRRHRPILTRTSKTYMERREREYLAEQAMKGH